jgi:hypothetical protein
MRRPPALAPAAAPLRPPQPRVLMGPFRLLVTKGGDSTQAGADHQCTLRVHFASAKQCVAGGGDKGKMTLPPSKSILLF